MADIIKHLKTLFPLPKSWQNDEKAFGMRLEDAFRWLQINTHLSVSQRTLRMFLEDTDTTWAKVWEKLNMLKAGETATIYVRPDAASVLTGGARSSALSGTVTRSSSSGFIFMTRVGGTGNGFLIGSITGASESSAGTWADNPISTNVNSLLSDVEDLKAMHKSFTITAGSGMMVGQYFNLTNGSRIRIDLFGNSDTRMGSALVLVRSGTGTTAGDVIIKKFGMGSDTNVETDSKNKIIVTASNGSVIVECTVYNGDITE